MSDTERAPIDAYAVGINEIENYRIDAEDRLYIAQMRAVYLFDHNERTHCCEITPSHYLIHLYDEVILTEDGHALPESEIEALYEKYELHGESECIYVHCDTIDKIIEKNDQTRLYHYGGTELSYEEADYDEQITQLEEEFRCNYPF